MAVSIPLITAGIGAGTSLYGMMNQPDQPQNPMMQGGMMPPPPQQSPMPWQAPWMTDSATGAYGGTQNLGQYNTWASLLPMYQQAAGQAMNNPYAENYQQRAGMAADTGWNTGNAQVGAGYNLMNAGQGMLPYAQQIMQMGFDPQNALYDRTLHQTTEQQRAGQAARGISMSPYGAGLENQALQNFNIDWQNNQLNRANTAAQGAGYITNSGANAINLGQNVGTLGLQQLASSAALPYTTANTIAGAPLSFLDRYGAAGNSAAQLPMAQIESYLKYLGMGNQAGGVGNQATANANSLYATQVSGGNSNYANQITAQNNQFNQSQTLGKNFGASMQGIGTNVGKLYEKGGPFAGWGYTA